MSDPFEAGAVLIEVEATEFRQLFDPLDPAPYPERDLDPKAVDFIVDWSKEAPRDAPFALLVHLDGPPSPPDSEAMLSHAVHEFFSQRSQAYRRKLDALFRRGRISLAIGLSFLALTVAISDLLALKLRGSQLGDILRQGIAIVGWVAMWRPLEVFLYDWWPIKAEIKLSDRLARMPVRVKQG